MKRITFLAIAFAAVALSAQSASAAVTFDFNVVISGSPVGGPTFATVVIENDGADTVNFTMTNTSDPGTSGGQFISKLLLNVDPFVAGTMTWSDPTISSYSFDEDGENDSGASFDYEVRFETANNGNRFVSGEVVSWSVTGSGVTESSFQAMSAGNSPQQGMVHIQAIPDNGGSAKVVAGEPVPEPASLGAIALGVAALLGRRKKK